MSGTQSEQQAERELPKCDGLALCISGVMIVLAFAGILYGAAVAVFR